jgi:hypothetical protein
MDEELQPASRGPWSMPVLVAALLVVGLALGAGTSWFVLSRPDRAVAGPVCDRYRTVDVAVAPEMYAVVVAALDEVTPACTRAEPAMRTGTEVAAGVWLGGELPDVWVPEAHFLTTASYLGKAAHPRLLARSLARTPVLLVGGPAARRFPSWAAAEASRLVTVPDPLESAAGTLAAVAPRAEARHLGRSRADAQQALVPFAQAQGARRADGRDATVRPAMFARTSPRLVVTTGQDLAGAPTRADLRDLTPAVGSLELDFPLALGADAAPGSRALARDLMDHLATPDGRALLAEHALQPPGGAAPALRTPSAEAVSAAVYSWRTLAIPSSILAVVDASGSMDFETGSGTRMDLLADAAGIGLGFLPDHARVGLWVFSIDQGGPGQDWRELEPVRRLDDLRRGRTQRYALRQRAGELSGLTGGGTGLYDTALAAYQEAVRRYRPNYSNAVVLMTDGRNDDADSISLAALLDGLARLRDPDRPVRLVGIAISDDADLDALEQMARVTGGEAYLADRPEDVLEVFAQAVLSR